jgi:F-type H+-transporting ATPase subunit gamma
MPNLKDIKNRIGSVESTKKITRAMKMVAAAKVKKAETTVKSSRPFTSELNTMFAKLLNAVGDYSDEGLKIKQAIDNYPKLLEVRELKTVGLLAITSNKGLAGAYNANIVRKTVNKIEEYNAQGIKVLLFIIGQKGVAPLKRRVQNLDCEIAGTYISIMNDPTGAASHVITEDIATYFVEGQIDKIEVITTRFKNMMSYFVEEWCVLPLCNDEITTSSDLPALDPLMEFYPNIHAILQKVVPLYITNIIFQSILEAQASELASRMTAMSAATTNAEKMIGDLSILYNKSRQNAITQELIEVVSGANSQSAG